MAKARNLLLKKHLFAFQDTVISFIILDIIAEIL